MMTSGLEGAGAGAGAGASMAVQKLHDVCKATFPLSAAPAVSVQSLQRVRTLLNKIQCSDVGLDAAADQQDEQRGFGVFGLHGPRRGGRHSRSAPPISYLDLYECDAFSMGVFCLPTSAVIPLHNHPGMTVLSKLLYGSLHVKAFDWVNPPAYDKREGRGGGALRRLAKLVEDGVSSFPCETAVLHPTAGGNIHAFTAVTPCAVLDVLAPPYSAVRGRNCTYYREYPVRARGREEDDEERSLSGYSWLEEFQPPDDFVVHRGIYKGPKVAP